MLRHLTTVREINAALARSVVGLAHPVYCILPDEVDTVHRVFWSRTVHGELQVQLLRTGRWVKPAKVYQ
jgi:hypothetical protein